MALQQVTLADILMSSFRIAGVTKGPGRIPSPDQFAEAILLINRMIGSWNCDPLRILGPSIHDYPLTTAKSYAMAPGLAIDAPRPQKITGATILLPTSPIVRRELDIIDEDEWRLISVQDIPNTIPTKLFNDDSDPAQCVLYLWGQPLSSYRLELYAWQPLVKFADTADVVTLTDGYELAMTYNLAILIASHFKSQGAEVSNDDRAIARDSLMTVENLNAPSPIMRTDYGGTGRGFNYLTGR